MKTSNISAKKFIQKHGFLIGTISMLFFSYLTFYISFYVRHPLFYIAIILLIIIFAWILKLIKFKKHIIKYGVILGVATIIYTFSFKLLDPSGNKLTIARLFALLFITFGSIFLGLIVFKKNNDGYISLKEALKISIGIALIGGLISVLWEILRIHVVDTGIIDQYNENHFKRAAENSIEFIQEDLDRRISIVQPYRSPLIMVSRRMVEHLSHGIVIGFILGLFIRKKRDPFK